MPRKVWQREVGPGWSSFVTINNHAVTLEQIGPDECVSCYRFSDGALIWRHAMPGRFESIVSGDGPRATPIIAGNRVYAVGATGRFVCLDIVSGKLAWSIDLLKHFNAENLGNGVCASPLIDGDRVRWIGVVNHPQKVELLRNAAALVFPIQWDEPFGLVMIEAMACGAPVLAVRRGSVPEIVDDGVTGFTGKTAGELASYVAKACALDRQKVHKHAASRFGHGRMVEEYVALYRSLIGNR